MGNNLSAVIDSRKEAALKAIERIKAMLDKIPVNPDPGADDVRIMAHVVAELVFVDITLEQYVGDITGMRYNNKYHCKECDHLWESEWSCACNDKCPKCNGEHEPYQSEPI